MVKTAEKMWQESEAISQSLPFPEGNGIHIVSSVSAQHHYGLSYRVMLPADNGVVNWPQTAPLSRIYDCRKPYCETVYLG